MSTTLFEEWAAGRGMEGPLFERQRERLRIAAQLHDLGKIGISDTLLKNPGRLTPEDFAQVKKHVLIGARLFSDHSTDFDQAAQDVALNHHERWDGGGYPGHVTSVDGGMMMTGAGKRGDEIPLFARIVGLADVYDALLSRRSYKEPWTPRRAQAYIREESGKHFDPDLVEIFFRRLRDIEEHYERFPP